MANISPLMILVLVWVGFWRGPESAYGGERLVTFGGAVTEVVFALGAGDEVVAVDASSVYPERVAGLPRVGYYRMVSAEGVLAQRPDRVLATAEAGPPEVLEQLRRVGVDVTMVPDGLGLLGCLGRIRAVGGILGREERAEAMCEGIRRGLAGVPALEGDPPKVLFVFAHGAGTWNVAGVGTAADEMIRLAGGRNAATGYAGYRPLTAEAVVAAQPDVILTGSGGLAGRGGQEGLLKVPGVGSTPAGRDRRVVAMDELYLLGFGPRTAEAVRELNRELSGER